VTLFPICSSNVVGGNAVNSGLVALSVPFHQWGLIAQARDVLPYAGVQAAVPDL
jgi:hypothetical protein